MQDTLDKLKGTTTREMRGMVKTDEKANRARTIQEYSYCPHCGRKGLYQLHGKYCRCRYCGLYRILLRESDLRDEREFMVPAAKRGIQ